MTVRALWIACLLALAAAGVLPGNALAHGVHNHAAGMTPAAQSTSTAPSENSVKSRAGPHHASDSRPLAGAAEPSHCPDGPLGGCCCGHAVLLHYVPSAANARSDAFVQEPRTHDRPAALHSTGYRPALFLLSAPPRAPPLSPAAA